MQGGTKDGIRYGEVLYSDLYEPGPFNHNKTIMKWAEEVPTTSMGEDPTLEDVSPLFRATEPGDFQHAISQNGEQAHSIRKRGSHADLRAEYELGANNHKGCNPC
ncbi:hypothetical protein J7T55_013008 [Diaporthe amygdali]|uniref:uncharacterized protein n=1 Tax=Phomopsis amygdali TaxID=1214568 RepID=UPI0022FDE0E6|nr:uncharacterized protein J7T55_013008 [Diaporthe amygdali]KAJ0118754.1 hypothetical protein J7T55_013008 [Diaporthe amygdali]